MSAGRPCAGARMGQAAESTESGTSDCPSATATARSTKRATCGVQRSLRQKISTGSVAGGTRLRMETP